MKHTRRRGILETRQVSRKEHVWTLTCSRWCFQFSSTRGRIILLSQRGPQPHPWNCDWVKDLEIRGVTWVSQVSPVSLPWALPRGREKRQSQRKTEAEVRGPTRDLKVLHRSLWRRKEPQAKIIRVAFRSWKSQENKLFPRALKRNQSYWNLKFNPMSLNLNSGLPEL